MTDKARSTIWLVDVATGAAAPARSPAPAPISRRAGRPTAGASPMSRPKAAARSCSSAGWTSGESARITGLPDSPESDRLVARRAAHRLCHDRPRRRPEARQGAATSRKAPNGPSRSRSSTRSPIAPTAPAISKPGYDQIFMVAADGGAPRQLTFGATQRRRRRFLDARRPRDPVQRQPVEELGARAARQRSLSRRASTAARPSR